MSTCQQNSSAPRGAVRTQRLSCGAAPKTARASARDRRAGSSPCRLRRPPRTSGRRASRNDAQLERASAMPTGRPGAPRRRSRRAARVRRTSSVATSESRCPPSSARGTRRPARARARPRPERMRARRAGRASAAARRPRRGPSLTIRWTKADAVGVGAHPLAPGRRPRPANRSSLSSASDVTCSGAWTITSCAPSAGCEANRSGSRAARRRPQADRPSSTTRVSAAPASRRPRPPRAEHRVEVRDRPGRPAGRIRRRRRPGGSPTPRAACGPRGPRRTGRTRRLLPAPGPRGRERVRALGPAGREDDPQPGELVYADLGSGQLPGVLAGGGGTLGCRSGLQERLHHVERQREDDRRVLVHPDVQQGLQVAELEGGGVLADDVRPPARASRPLGTRRRRR